MTKIFKRMVARVSGKTSRCQGRGEEMLADIAAGRPLVGDEVFGVRGYEHCAPHFTKAQWDIIWPAWCRQLKREVRARMLRENPAFVGVIPEPEEIT